MITPQRLREAADTLEELSTLAGYQHRQYVAWSAHALRKEAEVLEVPDVE